MILNTTNQIEAFRLLMLREALGLEIKGMSRHGQSVYSIVKAEFGLKGNKQRVFDMFTEILLKSNIMRGDTENAIHKQDDRPRG